MRNFPKNLMPLLLVLLKLISRISCNFTSKDLLVICGVRDNSTLTSIPSQCTAVSASSENMEHVRAIIDMKGPKPLILMKDLDYNKISGVRQEDIGEFFKELGDVDFDILVFENTYMNIQINDNASQSKFSKDLVTFIKQTKTHFVRKGFGLVIGNDIKAVTTRIDFSTLTKELDFFLLDSAEYRPCVPQEHQEDMKLLATEFDILSSFQLLTDIAHVTPDKIIYKIDLNIISWKVGLPHDMDYSDLCAKKLSVNRRYCYSTIQLLFEKARVRFTKNALGIYVNDITNDDYEGTCGCLTPTDKRPHFRGLKTIAGASQEGANDIHFYDCVEGKFPIINI